MGMIWVHHWSQFNRSRDYFAASPFDFGPLPPPARLQSLLGLTQEWLSSSSRRRLFSYTKTAYVEAFLACDVLLVWRRKWFQVNGINGCAISPDGILLATGGGDNSLCITNIATQELLYTVQCDNAVRVCLSYFVLTIMSRWVVSLGRPTGRVWSAWQVEAVSSKSQATNRTRLCIRSTRLYASQVWRSFLAYPCSAVWLRVQFSRDRCHRWRWQWSDTLGRVQHQQL